MSLQEKLHRLWHGETNGLTAAAVIVGASSLASRLVGVLRDRALASTFGAGPELDAYFAAFRVPDLLYSLIIMGALSAGFIPVFTDYLQNKGEKEAWKLAEQVLSTIGCITAVVCGLLALFAPQIVPLTVPGFTPEQIALTVQVSRIMFLSPFLLGLSAVMGGVLQALKRFLAFSLAPIFYNLGIIFGTLVLAPRYGVEGVAWGVALGAFLHLATQAVVAFPLGLRHLRLPTLAAPGVKRILRQMLPRTLSLGLTQINLVFLLAIASSLGLGSVAVFNLANNLQSFPVGIIGISFALAATPFLARSASQKDWTCFRNELSSGLTKIMFFILPATALFFLLRAQAVRLVLGAGAFDWSDTIRTANVLGLFVLSLLPQALVPLLARAFFSLENSRIPLISSAVAEAVNLALALLLKDRLGILALGVSFSVGAFLNAAILFTLLQRRGLGVKSREFGLSLLKTLAASIAIIGFGWPVRQFIGTEFPLTTFWQVALQAAAAGFVGITGFVVVAHLLKSREMIEFRRALQRKLLRQKPQIAGVEEVQGM
ncbi:MAG: murein biosynthesis integral membrane protein MurJ [Patescibacteria group bacterium]